jgi:lipoate-protein ligase A
VTRYKFFSRPITIEIFPYKVYSGLANMAIDHFLASIHGKYSNPIMRFYGWQPFCISLGIHQKEIIMNQDKLRAEGYQWIRRPTGGRAILHANELTYSVIISKEVMRHQDLYRFLHLVIAEALNTLGFFVILNNKNESVPVIKNDILDSLCFTSSARTEIQYSGKKVVGSAQKIYKNSILQHGSILIDETHKQVIDFLNISPEKKGSLTAELKDKTISLKEIKPETPSKKLMVRRIIKQLEKVENISLITGYLSKQDIKTAMEQYPF